MLATRFKLMAHREARDLPTHAFVMARKDESLGPRLEPTKNGIEIVVVDDAESPTEN